MTADSIQAFRETYRATLISPGYSGVRHLAFTFGAGSAAVIAALLALDDVRPIEWLTVLVTFLYANLAEYLGHRGPMHHRRRWLGMVYERHTKQHHRFFTDQAMAFDTLRDLWAVLFPPVLATFFIAAFLVPMAAAVAWLATPNVGRLFVATSLAYFLNYEFLHLSYHLPPEHPVSQWSVIRRLKALHQRHHDPRLMAHYNFNITYPVCDWLFGTLYRPGDEVRRAG